MGGARGNLAPWDAALGTLQANAVRQIQPMDAGLAFTGRGIPRCRLLPRRRCEWARLFAREQEDEEQSPLENVLEMQEGLIS